MKKIMIVDDELDIIDVLKRYLNKTKKVEVVINSDSQIALNSIKKENYDLVLTDIMMPIMDGMDLLKSIKEASPSTKVVLMTAYSTQRKKEQSEDLCADGYIEKPFKNLKDVEDQLFSLLDIK